MTPKCSGRRDRLLSLLGRSTFWLALLSCGYRSDTTAWAGQSLGCQACDLDHDGDVDQVDFGVLQACYAGAGVEQTDPSCQLARLDGDSDVDADDIILFLSCACGPSMPIPPGRLLVTELMASNAATIRDPDQSSEAYPDWIELYNDDSELRELGGLYLTNDLSLPTRWQIPPGVRIGPGDRLLFWADSDPEQGPTHTTFKLSKDGASVGLFAADGETLIDSVTFGPLDTDVSWGRLPDISDRWRLFATPEEPPTPGEPNGRAGNVPRVLITEIMYHPYSPELEPEPLSEEFIELYNAGATMVNLSGWEFSDGVDFTFPPGTSLSTGEYLVVSADVAAFHAKYPGVTNVVGDWSKRLSNDGEQIAIVDAAGRVIDRVEYSDQSEWAVRQRGPLDHGHNGWVWFAAHDGGGSSLERVNTALPGQFGHNWASSTLAGGTPGTANSVASTDIAPIIANVTQTPVVPHSTDTVQLTAQVIDELKTGRTVKAYYRLDGTTAFAAVEMRDDGDSGDGVAGDGVYGCTLPGQPDGTIVEYYFEAVDANGNARRQPAFALPANAPLANRLYRVDDGFDPTWVAGQQPVYSIIMTAAEQAELADIGDSSTDGIAEQESNAQMNGTFVSLDGDGLKDRFNVGVRIRGKGSRNDPPNNYRINFVHEHAWNDVTAINLNTKYPWLQVLGGRLFQAAGLVTADTEIVQVRVNGRNLAETSRRMFGAYMRLEAYDGEFAAGHFPDDDGGNLYTCRGWISQGGTTWFGDLDYRGIDPTLYRINYSKETNSAAEDWADLIHMTDVLSNTPDETYAQEVATVVDVDQWLRWFAFQALLGNAETNLGNGVGDDYSMYAGEQDPRFVLLPHDLDTLFGTGYGTGAKTTESIWLAAAVHNVKRFLQNPEFCHRYYRQLRQLAQTLFSPGQLDPMVDNLLGEWVPADERDAIKTFAAERNAYVLSQIPAALTIESHLPTVAGRKYSTQSMAALHGQANAYDTRSVLVNGEPAQWDCVAGTWSIGANDAAGTLTLISKGSTWRYLDNGTDQGTAWKESGFDDSTWKGPQAARLGYGGDGETSPLLSYGPDANNKYITYYFRRSFEVGDTSEFAGLTLRLLRDDGAAVYVNGTRVPLPQSVSNMPEPFDYLTEASSTVGDADEDVYFEASLSPALLIPNSTNVIAVEIHQTSLTSTDLSFDLELVANTAAFTTLIGKGTTWRYLDDGTNQGTAWKESSFDDSTWKGPQAARLGYGGDGETPPALSYGPDANNKYITYYFRRGFDVGDASKFTGLKLRLLRDDGAAVYINGTPVPLPQSVSNMPGTFDYLTTASSTVGDANEDTYFEASISPSVLIPNSTNMMAVEVHQTSSDSSDLGFDLELVAETATLTTGVPLAPGLNTVVVQAFDGLNGTGNEIDRSTIDILYDDALGNTLSGTLSADLTLDTNSSPWHVVGDVVVPAGVTLTLQPGVVVFFEPGTGVTINGRLIAEGDETARIVLTRNPTASGTWSGLSFENTQQANVMSYVDQSYGDGQGHSVGVSSSRLLLDHVDWSGVSTTMLEVDHPSVVVQNCIVPGAGSRELFHGLYLSGSEYFIIQNTTFGKPAGYNDVVDFSGCKRPGPILQVYNCTFLGGDDDGLDLDGTDAHLEGNLFTNFHQGSGNPGTSNAVSTGIRLDLNSDIVVVRNVFIDNDHAVLLKEDCFARFEHNTVFNCAIAVINFGEPERGYTPGRGAALDGNILYGYPMAFQNVNLNPGLQLTMNRTLVAAGEHGYGVGNIDDDPLFVDPPADLHLQPNSPARGIGLVGLDLGAYVPGGAGIAGAPNGITDQTTVALSVWGPGLVQYRYRLRDDGTWGPWSADQAIATPLTLTGLQDGHSYAVEVVGQNSAAVWQQESEAAGTPTWVVDTTP